MKLVIDIPDEMYRNAKTDMLCGSEVIVNAIKNGIPQESKTETVTEFADRCKECGARYGRLLQQEPKTQMIEKSNFNIEQYKADLQCAYDCGFEAGKKAEQEPCTDAVSRDTEWYDIRTQINELPSVTQKSGKWIDYSYEEGYVECPFCGHATTCEDNIDELHYCFYCGAELSGEEQTE